MDRVTPRTGRDLFTEAIREQAPGRTWEECDPWVRQMWNAIAAAHQHERGERRYVRFRDEWSEPLDAPPRWYTAECVGVAQHGRGHSSRWEERWRVDSLERWEYAAEELLIGVVAAERLPWPVSGQWDQAAVRPPDDAREERA